MMLGFSSCAACCGEEDVCFAGGTNFSEAFSTTLPSLWTDQPFGGGAPDPLFETASGYLKMNTYTVSGSVSGCTHCAFSSAAHDYIEISADIVQGWKAGIGVVFATTGSSTPDIGLIYNNEVADDKIIRYPVSPLPGGGWPTGYTPPITLKIKMYKQAANYWDAYFYVDDVELTSVQLDDADQWSPGGQLQALCFGASDSGEIEPRWDNFNFIITGPGLTASGDGTIGGAVEHDAGTGSPFYTHIDDGSSDYISNDATETDSEAWFSLDNTLSGFTGWATLNIKVEVMGTSFSDDTCTLTAQVFDADNDTSTPLTDAQQIGSDADTTQTTRVVAFGSLTGDKTAWDGAYIRFSWDYTKTGSPDNGQLRLYNFLLQGK